MNTKKKQRVVYFNGHFVPESEAKVSIYDSSLMFGDMVFEMTRSFNKKQFKLKDHISRLMQGIKILRIPFDHSAAEIEKACNKTIEMNSDIDGKIIIHCVGKNRNYALVKLEFYTKNACHHY